ncbi:neuropeptide-like protein C4orf48 homolog isoform X2 [Catharus ustulatus]|uniref:NELL2-interacting cell ontogeny regulator 1 n=1 Tax=Catharus ustulatus TaxID=91951 RepID=A0A8C3TTR3_CATUS|nr:neuropeptide-like protein C4orf48 homolog isoform X2 [Catharus ustulatus]
MAMTPIREGGCRRGACSEWLWSSACSLQLLQGSGTQARTGIRQGRQLELLMGGMALPLLWSEMRAGILLLSALSLLSASLVGAGQDSGSVIPAESRPCVDCHAFEFMQRALQDLKKTAYSLDTRTETLLLRAEKRGLCDCFRAIH